MVDILDGPNQLYDSFTARLKEFHLHKLAYTPEHFIRKANLERANREVLRVELKKQKEHNAELIERCQQLEGEMTIVKWYQEVMEEGLDTK